MSEAMFPSSAEQTGLVEVEALASHVVLGTSIGLFKELNEDSIGGRVRDGRVRICIADGHWGPAVAREITAYWMDEGVDFPLSLVGARKHAEVLESRFFETYGKPRMNPNRDFTPEASFIAMEIDGDVLRITGYGDCRMLMVRDGKKVFALPTNETWIGAFSHLGIRDRTPAKEATVFFRKRLRPEDCILIFSDGLDECIYEQEAIDEATIVETTRLADAAQIFRALIAKAFELGAEDNVSLAVWTNTQK